MNDLRCPIDSVLLTKEEWARRPNKTIQHVPIGEPKGLSADDIKASIDFIRTNNLRLN